MQLQLWFFTSLSISPRFWIMFLFMRHYIALIISQMLMNLYWPKSNHLSVLGPMMRGSVPSLWKWLANCLSTCLSTNAEHRKQLVYSSLRTSPSMREIPRSYAHWPIVLPSLNVSAGTSLLWCTPSLLIILCTLMTPTFITSDPTSLNSRLLYPIASSMFNLDAQLTSQTLYVENQT